MFTGGDEREWDPLGRGREGGIAMRTITIFLFLGMKVWLEIERQKFSYILNKYK